MLLLLVLLLLELELLLFWRLSDEEEDDEDNKEVGEGKIGTCWIVLLEVLDKLFTDLLLLPLLALFGLREEEDDKFKDLFDCDDDDDDENEEDFLFNWFSLLLLSLSYFICLATPPPPLDVFNEVDFLLKFIEIEPLPSDLDVDDDEEDSTVDLIFLISLVY